MSWRTFISKCFKDKEGNIAIFQAPNLPIILWFTCAVLNTFIADTSTVHRVLETVGFGALFVWAWLEIFYGVNYFRRALGAIILVVSVLLRSNVL